MPAAVALKPLGELCNLMVVEETLPMRGGWELDRGATSDVRGGTV